jgi:hypothetical protein
MAVKREFQRQPFEADGTTSVVYRSNQVKSDCGGTIERREPLLGTKDAGAYRAPDLQEILDTRLALGVVVEKREVVTQGVVLWTYRNCLP